jgi:hypothetical protein
MIRAPHNERLHLTPRFATPQVNASALARRRTSHRKAVIL